MSLSYFSLSPTPCTHRAFRILKKLLETNDIESSEDYYEDMINSLIRLSAQPINLNSAGFDSLKMLFFLSDAQIDNLLDFRKKTRAVYSPERTSTRHRNQSTGFIQHQTIYTHRNIHPRKAIPLSPIARNSRPLKNDPPKTSRLQKVQQESLFV